LMKTLGVEVVPIDMLHDSGLPEIDGLFIGGGFPETHMEELEANSAMRESVKKAIEDGLPTYAECGGLMYLSRSIHWDDRSANMVGVIPGDTHMHERPRGRGYTRLQETNHHPWPKLGAISEGFSFPAHEFHHSSLDIDQKNPTYAYKVLRGTGINGENDGYIHKNMLASYVHLRNVAGNQWVSRFVQFVRDHSPRPNDDPNGY
jgi:cobyrinic acid a,c-diamide synthase